MSNKNALQDSAQLGFSELAHTCAHEKYMKSLARDELYSQIIGTEAFTRLKGISFLGAIDYLPEYKNIRRVYKSRWKHSLSVAALAKLIAEKRKYDQELTRHIVVAGLLHDIGHPPLSHSVEPFFKSRFGYGHHEMGEMLLDGKVEKGECLNKIINSSLDLSFIKKLIDGKVCEADGGDLFSSKINLDTIDGIIRSSRYINKYSYSLSPVTVALASFTDKASERYKVLDNFWLLKDFIYKALITSGNGLNADIQSRIRFEQGYEKISEQSLFVTENSWHQKFSSVFNLIRSVSSDQQQPGKAGQSIRFIRRNYFINKNEVIHDKRYLYTKEKETLIVS